MRVCVTVFSYFLGCGVRFLVGSLSQLLLLDEDVPQVFIHLKRKRERERERDRKTDRDQGQISDKHSEWFVCVGERRDSKTREQEPPHIKEGLFSTTSAH